ARERRRRARGEHRRAGAGVGARRGRIGGGGAAPAGAPRERPRGVVAVALSHPARGSRLVLRLMAILVLTQSEVEQLLDMGGCIEAMAEVLAALERNELFLPLRMIAFPPGQSSAIGLMPSYRGGESAAYALKTICLFPDNPSRGLDPHQGTVTLFSGETGEVRALMNASAITAIRTAAVSGVATQLLAREDAGDLAIIGSGVQARAHIEA